MQTTHIETKTYYRLISHIYDAVLTPDKWKKFLHELTDALDCHSVPLQFPYKGVQVTQSLCHFLDIPNRLSNHDKKLLQALLPHIQRSIEISRRYEEMEDRIKTTIDILEKLPYGIVFLSGNGFPVRHNARAAQICDKENNLFLNANGISLKDPKENKTLQDAISHAMDKSANRQGYAIKVTTHDDLLHIFISPLKETQCNLYIPGDNVQAVMFISSTKHTPNLSGEALSDMFGLSRAEIRLVAELIRGLSIEETAERLFVSKHTLRAQLRSIFRKTETRSQSDLIRCLLHSPLVLNQKL